MKSQLPGLDILRHALTSLSSLPEENWLSFARRLHWEQFARKTVLVDQGAKIESIHFVVQGLVKTAFIEADGKEITKGFVAERLLIDKERREYQMLALNAEQRYREFLQNFPQLLDRIPQYEIASYLGITPVSLSQIRRKLAGTSGAG